jgi:hypothetical protein
MTIKTNETSRPKRFFSQKNQTQIFYDTRAERRLMLLLEFDPSVDCYRPFGFGMVNPRTHKELDASPGFVVTRRGAREYIILSDQLADNTKLAAAVKLQMQEEEYLPITLTIHRPAAIENDSKAKSLELICGGGQS